MNDKWLEWAPRLVLVGSLLLAASAAAKLTGTLLLPAAAVPPERADGTAGGAAAAVADHAARIQQAKLMGEAPKVVAQRVAKLPETRLNLKLIGVLATGTDSGLAIIADGRGEAKLYSVGKRLPGGAALREVLLDRVLLEGPTGLETLRLYDASLPGGPLGARDSSRSSSVSAVSGGRDAGAANRNRASQADRRAVWSKSAFGRFRGSRPYGAAGVGSVQAGPGFSGTAPRLPQASRSGGPPDSSDLGALRDQLIRNPSLLTRAVSAREVTRNGELVGYALDFHTEDPIVSQLGLQSGDVVTQVNGIRLNGPTQGLQVVNALTTAPVVTATIERNGQRIRVTRSFK